MRLSVLTTLEESLRIWIRHGLFFLLLTLFLLFPVFVFPSTGHHSIGHEPRLSFEVVARQTASFVLSVIFQAAASAAVLALLSIPLRHDKWRGCAQSVHRYTGQLVGVQVWLFFIGLTFTVAFGGIFLMLHVVFDLSLLWIALLQFVFLLFLKYALASPLVVVENLKAYPALASSWRMTKHRFGYVFGCYLFTEILQVGVAGGIARLPTPGMLSASILIFETFLQTFWYVLPWVMYIRIRDALVAEAIDRVTPLDPA